MDLSRLQIDRGVGPRRAHRRRLRLAPWLAVAALGTAAWVYRAPLSALAARAGSAPVEVATVVRGELGVVAAASGTAANGYIVAQRRAALSADTPGRIVELNVTEGSVLQKGAVVARLYSEELEAALRGAESELAAAGAAVTASAARVRASERRLAEAEARVAATLAGADEARAALGLAERELARVSALVDTGGVPAERVDQAGATVTQTRARVASAEAGVHSARVAVESARADVEVARADVAQLEARLPVLAAARDLSRATLDKTYVRAPFDGVVVLKDAEVGEVVSPNALGGQSRGSVATMIDPTSLEVQVELPETSLASVVEDRAAWVYLDAFPNERFQGRVLRIWPTANRQKATIEVRVGLEALDPRLRPEMGARVVFPPDTAMDAAPEPTPKLLVPATAIVERGGAQGVFVVAVDTAEFRRVTPGASVGRRRALEVPSEVAEGDRVVSAPTGALADGDKVRVQQP